MANYCAKDDVVFIAGENNPVAPEGLSSLLIAKS
jgi:hypothetical protein